MAWIKFGKKDINTRAITDLTPNGHGELCLWAGNDKLVNLSGLGISKKKALELIKEAEQDEIKQAFSAVKDEIVAEVTENIKAELSMDKPKFSSPLSLKANKKQFFLAMQVQIMLEKRLNSRQLWVMYSPIGIQRL